MNWFLQAYWWIPAAALLATGLAAMIATLMPLRRVKRYASAEISELEESFPAVSVIVNAVEDGHTLDRLLPALLSQQYPAPYEVVVVDGGDSEVTRRVVALLQPNHPNLYLTFAPTGSRNVSWRKLAMLIGIKAASYERMVFTVGNALVDSPNWLRDMSRGFARGAGIVIGSRVMVDSDNHWPNRSDAFRQMDADVQYLSAAIGGYAYRGNRANLGFTKQAFFEVKGFSDSLNLVNGDDDVFIRKIAQPGNAFVALTPDSIVRVEEVDPDEAWWRERVASRFTSGMLRRGPRIRRGLTSLLWWLWLLMSVITALTPLLLPTEMLIERCALWGSVLLIGLGVCLPVMFVWRSTARTLGNRPLCWSVPFMMLRGPIGNIGLKFSRRARHARHFTWQA